MAAMLHSAMRRTLVGVIIGYFVVVGAAGAQASAYLSLDDPRSALLEHLIARGDVADPTPMFRPWRWADLVRSLKAAKLAPASVSGRMVSGLAQGLAEAPRGYAVEARAGLQSATHARRDLLQPAGSGGAWPFGEAAVRAHYGPVAVAVRSTFEPRLRHDPDWVDASSTEPRTAQWRVAEATASFQTTTVRVTLGRQAQQWGPLGLSGLALSDEAYPRTGLLLEVSLGPFRLAAEGAELRHVADAMVPGARHFVAHRLGVRLSPKLHIAVWETGVVSQRSGGTGAFLLDPFRPLVIGHLVGLPDDRNILLGTDLAWRPNSRLLLEAQGALDDFGSDDPASARPARWGMILGASGPIGANLSWQSRFTAATSLAFRTHTPEQNYTDGGVGIGRNSADQAEFRFSLGVPVNPRWLLRPEVAVLRQGEGSLDDAFPTGAELAATPTFFIGTVSTTWRSGLGIIGWQGPLALAAFGGLQHTRNAEHLSGRMQTRFEGRFQATMGFTLGGRVR
jgi:hypothetical protein